MPRSAIDQQLDEKTQYTLGAQDVAQMAHDLFHAMLGMQINPEPTESFSAPDATIQASIGIAGDYQTKRVDSLPLICSLAKELIRMLQQREH